MIALNEIKKNPEFYRKKYESMGKNINLKRILTLGDDLSKLQQTLEQTKSSLSKMSSNVTVLRNQKKPTNEFEHKLDNLNKKMNKTQTLYDKTHRKLNKMLKKLPNPATKENETNISIGISKNAIEKQDLLDFLKTFLSFSVQKENSKSYLALSKNQITDENYLPQAIIFENEILILAKIDNFETIKNKLLKFIFNNSVACTQVSIKKLNFCASEQYIVILNENLEVEIQIIGEYLTREFGLKYFDTQKGMTKFINQILITLKKDD